MSKSKELLLTAFALFALFFGAGNLLLPPLLGYNAADDWPIVVTGFAITAVIIPIIGIYAHARLQGTLFDFGRKISPLFSSIYCLIIYAIALAIPSPRTAAATHEIAIYPFFENDALLTSSIYFILVLIFVLNRSKIMSIIGKYLTPIIVLMLLAMIAIGIFGSEAIVHEATDLSPLSTGILEGYQTFDAIGAAVVGAFIIISINLRGHQDYGYKKKLIAKAGLIAGLGLLIMYTGLIAVGAYYGNDVMQADGMSSDMVRASLLTGIIKGTLGAQANTFLSALLALACFTTAVGIIAGAADYFKGIFGNSDFAYKVTAVVGCILGVGVGQMDFHSIIVVAIPVLAFIYPITIVLILLNALPDRWAPPKVFRAVVLSTFVFSLPDVISGIFGPEFLGDSLSWIPLSAYSLGWVLPAIISYSISKFLHEEA